MQPNRQLVPKIYKRMKKLRSKIKSFIGNKWLPCTFCTLVAGGYLPNLVHAETQPRLEIHTLAIKPGPIPNSFEQLRVTELADNLIKHLEQAVQWVDRPHENLSLTALAPKIRSAVSTHPEVRLSIEQRATAALETREAYSGFFPQITASVEAGKRRNSAVTTPWNHVPAYDDSSKALALTAQQLVYDFGALSFQLDALAAKERSAGANSELKISELALRAVISWLEMFRARQILLLAEMNVLSRRQIMTFIEERERLGGSSKSDVLRARARLADAQVSVTEAMIKIDSAEAGYREIFNEAPPTNIRLPRLPELAILRYDDLNYSFDRSPQFAQAKAQTEAAELEAKSAAAALKPTIYFDVTARRRDLGGQSTPGTDWTAGFVVRQNLYSGGSGLARKKQAEQRAAEARLSQENVKRQLERIYAQGLADVKNQVATVAARKEAAEVAAVALEAVREQFAFRRGSLLDLLRAQEELYIAGRQFIDGIVDASQAHYRLLHLTMELNELFEIPPASTLNSK